MRSAYRLAELFPYECSGDLAVLLQMHLRGQCPSEAQADEAVALVFLVRFIEVIAPIRKGYP